MNQNTAGAVLLLILATAGFVQEQPAVWFFAGLSAALVFIEKELSMAHVLYGWRELHVLSVIAALSSWAAVIAAALLLT